MLDPVSLKDANGAVVHFDRERYQQRSLRNFQAFPQVRVQVHGFRHVVELSNGQTKGWVVEFGDHGLGFM